MSDFVGFMAARTRNIDMGYYDPMNSRNFSDDSIRRAAREAAKRNRSDPFAYNRAINVLKQGFYTPDELNSNLSI